MIRLPYTVLHIRTNWMRPRCSCQTGPVFTWKTRCAAAGPVGRTPRWVVFLHLPLATKRGPREALHEAAVLTLTLWLPGLTQRHLVAAWPDPMAAWPDPTPVAGGLRSSGQGTETEIPSAPFPLAHQIRNNHPGHVPCSCSIRCVAA